MRCLLAAMDGMTTAAFRSLCFGYGADGATTEMIGALGFARAKRKMNPINQALVMRRPEEGFLAAQIIGSEPDAMAEAARRLEAMGHFNAIEINMGCPARKVTGSGNGSALLKDPALAEKIISAVRGAVSLPLRLKTRLGWDAGHLTAARIAVAAENAGCNEIILHGRTREQFYQGDVDIEAMREVISAVSIPVYANGAVTSARGARAFLESTGAAGLCVGRAALKEPWIFQDIRALEDGNEPKPRLLPERIRLLQLFADRLVQQKRECYAICEMRKYVGWWISGFSDSDALCARVNASTGLSAFQDILEDYLIRHIQTDDIYPVAAPIVLDTMPRPRSIAGPVTRPV